MFLDTDPSQVLTRARSLEHDRIQPGEWSDWAPLDQATVPDQYLATFLAASTLADGAALGGSVKGRVMVRLVIEREDGEPLRTVEYEIASSRIPSRI